MSNVLVANATDHRQTAKIARRSTTSSTRPASPCVQHDVFARRLMRLIGKRRRGPADTSRDQERTDWDAVTRFASVFASRLTPVAG